MIKDNKSACGRVDIGGQAVMEGVMMKAPKSIAVSVRKSGDTILTKLKPYVAPSEKHPWMGWPFIRGIVSMCTMFSMGMATLQDSTDMLGMLEEEPTKFELWLSKKLGKGVDKIVMGVAVFLAIILSLGLFFFLPEAVASLLKNFIKQEWLVNLLSGIVRICLLIGYILFCAKVPDVRRTFQYHGAEHKTVYCHENNLALTPENASQFSTLHPRCGTSFLLIVFFISIIIFTTVGYFFEAIGMPINNVFLRFLSRLIFLPVVAGISYEILKGLAHSDGKLARILRWPGLQMQRLTTKEPTKDMLEVAIVSMNVALYGLPEGCETTPEGYTIIHDYRITDPVLRNEIQPASANDGDAAAEENVNPPAEDTLEETEKAE